MEKMAANSAPNELDAVDALAAIAAGRLSAEALTRACLARIAEREIFLRGEIGKAAENGDAEAMAQLERQLASERKSLEAECEEKKEKIRAGQGDQSSS